MYYFGTEGHSKTGDTSQIIRPGKMLFNTSLSLLRTQFIHSEMQGLEPIIESMFCNFKWEESK